MKNFKVAKIAHFALLSAFAIFFTACATSDLRSNAISLRIWADDAIRDICWSVESSAQCEEILQTACEAGDYRDCALLGYTYAKHLNVPTADYRAKEDKAIALFKAACEGKNGSGCFLLGLMQGNDVLKVQGCEYGDFFACSHIVANRESGTNIDVDGKVRFAPRFDEKVVRWALNRNIELLKDECQKAHFRLANERDSDRIAQRELVLMECKEELKKAQDLDLDADLDANESGDVGDLGESSEAKSDSVEQNKSSVNPN